MDIIKISVLGSQGSGKSTLISSFISKAHYNSRFSQPAGGGGEIMQTPPYNRTKKNEYFLTKLNAQTGVQLLDTVGASGIALNSYEQRAIRNEDTASPAGESFYYNNDDPAESGESSRLLSKSNKFQAKFKTLGFIITCDLTRRETWEHAKALIRQIHACSSNPPPAQGRFTSSSASSTDKAEHVPIVLICTKQDALFSPSSNGGSLFFDVHVEAPKLFLDGEDVVVFAGNALKGEFAHVAGGPASLSGTRMFKFNDIMTYLTNRVKKLSLYEREKALQMQKNTVIHNDEEAQTKQKKAQYDESDDSSGEDAKCCARCCGRRKR